MNSVVERRVVGTFRYRADRAAIEVRYRESQGGMRRSFYVKGPDNDATRKKAETELARRVSGVARHTPANLTVGKWLDDWYKLQEPGGKERTLVAYRNRIDLYLKPVLGSYKLRTLEPADVADAMARLERMPGQRVERLSVGTIEAAFKVLTAALADAYELKKAPLNAARFVRIARAETVIEPPTQQDLDLLFEAIGDHPWRGVFSVMRYTGARLGEVLGMTWRRTDTETGIVQFVKQRTGSLKTRKSVRSVVIPRTLADELAAIPHRIGTDLVFSTASGRPLNERNVLRVFDRALAATGLAPDADADLDKFRPHDLRHSFATWLLESGVSPAMVQAVLGHSSLRMLDRYSHVRAVPGGDSYRRLVDAWGPDGAAAFGLWSPMFHESARVAAGRR